MPSLASLFEGPSPRGVFTPMGYGREIGRIHSSPTISSAPKKKNRKSSRRGRSGGNRKSSHKSTGARLGAKAGAFLGGMAQKSIGRIFGMGEYKESLAGHLGVDSETIAESASPEVNSLVAPLNSSQLVPIMHQDAEGTVRLTRREFVGTIVIAEQPTLYQIIVSPSNPGLFPWLSSMSTNFQQYAFLGFAAEYVPTSGVAVGGTNAALGQVAMAFKYNVIEDFDTWPITDLKGLLNMNGSVSSSPAAPGTCYMECDPSMSNQPVRFVRTEVNEGTNFSWQNYEAATLLIRTEGSQNLLEAQAGQLWITYEIVLMNPRPVRPPLPAVADKYDELVDELNRLREYSGPLTSAQIIRMQARVEELTAFTRSLEFVQERARSRCGQELQALMEEKTPPVIDPSVQKIIDEAAEYEREHRLPVAPPPTAVGSPEVFTFDEGELVGQPIPTPTRLRRTRTVGIQ